MKLLGYRPTELVVHQHAMSEGNRQADRRSLPDSKFCVLRYPGEALRKFIHGKHSNPEFLGNCLCIRHPETKLSFLKHCAWNDDLGAYV